MIVLPTWQILVRIPCSCSSHVLGPLETKKGAHRGLLSQGAVELISAFSRSQLLLSEQWWLHPPLLGHPRKQDLPLP